MAMEWISSLEISYPMVLFTSCFAVQRILLHWPCLLHAKSNVTMRKDLKNVHWIAHRGSKSEGLLENTMEAYKKGVEVGCTMLELDVRLTKDQKVVVFHDADFKRMTEGKVKEKLCDLNFDELPILTDDGIEPYEKHKLKASFVKTKKTPARVPLFEDVLKWLPDDRFLIVEVKENNYDLISQVHALLHKYDRQKNVVWFSLNEGICKKLRDFDPNMPTIASVTMTLKIVLYYYLGILPFMSLPFNVFGITADEVDINRLNSEPSFNSLPTFMKQILAFLLEGRPPYMMNSPRLFSHMKARGIPTWILGVNSEYDLRTATKSGVTAVLTDYPIWLLTHVKKNNIRLCTLE